MENKVYVNQKLNSFIDKLVMFSTKSETRKDLFSVRDNFKIIKKEQDSLSKRVYLQIILELEKVIKENPLINVHPIIIAKLKDNKSQEEKWFLVDGKMRMLAYYDLGEDFLNTEFTIIELSNYTTWNDIINLNINDHFKRMTPRALAEIQLRPFYKGEDKNV